MKTGKFQINAIPTTFTIKRLCREVHKFYNKLLLDQIKLRARTRFADVNDKAEIHDAMYAFK